LAPPEDWSETVRIPLFRPISTFSDVTGRSLTATPVASSTAFLMAGAGRTIGGSAMIFAPKGPSGLEQVPPEAVDLFGPSAFFPPGEPTGLPPLRSLSYSISMTSDIAEPPSSPRTVPIVLIPCHDGGQIPADAEHPDVTVRTA